MLGIRPMLANSLVPMAKPPRLRPVRIRARWRGPTASAGAPTGASGIGETDMGALCCIAQRHAALLSHDRVTPAGGYSGQGPVPAAAPAPRRRQAALLDRDQCPRPQRVRGWVHGGSTAAEEGRRWTFPSWDWGTRCC